MAVACDPGRPFPPRALPRERLAMLAATVDGAAADARVAAVARELSRAADLCVLRARELGHTYLHAAAYVDTCAEFLRPLYRREAPGVDTYRPVAETLRCGGDCGPLAAALVALARRYTGEPGVVYVAPPLGARLCWIRQRSRPLDHVAPLVAFGPAGGDAPLILDAGDDAPPGWFWLDVSQRARRNESPWEAAARLRGEGSEVST